MFQILSSYLKPFLGHLHIDIPMGNVQYQFINSSVVESNIKLNTLFQLVELVLYINLYQKSNDSACFQTFHAFSVFFTCVLKKI